MLRICRLPSETLFDHTWALRKVDIGEQVDHLAYATSSGTYVLGTSHSANFKLPEDDELHPDWRNEGMSFVVTYMRMLTGLVISFLPEVRQCSLKVVSPRTWTVIDRCAPKQLANEFPNTYTFLLREATH